MKKLVRDDIFSATERVSLHSSAKAAAVLYAAEQFLKDKIKDDFFWRPKTWKGGVLRIEVGHPAGALRVYAESEELLDYLRTTFPDFAFREVRTEVTG